MPIHLLLLVLGAALATGVGAQNQPPISQAYDQPYRPQYHFSPRKNWTNDPNGLVFFAGEYHLFFQYNPFGDEWGHMSWGHAVSRDLLHWDQLPVAIPEQDGIMIFTGSTVVDTRNSSGFCGKPEGCLVAIYTGHTPESKGRPALQTQNLAYSNDHGRTWTKYSGNPVLNLHMTDFRDPKVLWSEESKQWVMAVSLPNDHKVRFYGSPDLKHWTQMSDFGPEGATGGQWECPELFQLPIEGTADAKRWVLKVGLNPGALQGGSGEQYFIGSFDGRRFHNDNSASLQLWTDYGKDCYCALTFNGLAKEQRAAMIGWMDNWQYAAKLPTSPWRGQMTFPRSLSLRKTAEGLRLIQQPFEGIQRLEEKNSTEASGSDVKTANAALRQGSPGHSFRLNAEIQLGSAQETGVRILAAGGHYTSVGYDRTQKKLFVDRRQSGLTGFSSDFPAEVDAPLNIEAGSLKLDVLVDRNSVEVFANNGQVTMTMLVFPPSGANGVEVFEKDGRIAKASVRMWKVESIWERM